MKKRMQEARLRILGLLCFIAVGFTVGLAGLKLNGIINVPWWVITAPVWVVPVICLALVLGILVLLGPDIIATFRAERAYRRNIRAKMAEFLRRRSKA
jgi:hypothetical protein